MHTLLHARKYLQNGWSVIPLHPRTKDKPLFDWKEFQERYATQSEIDKWFNGTNNNVAIVTGKISNLTVLDADGDIGLQDILRMGLASPITSVTGSGGRHLFFKHSGQTNKRTSKDHQGLDSRGEGGFVAAPPSLHPSGNQYKWMHGMPNQSSLPDWPKGLLQSSPAAGSQISEIKPTEPWIVDTLKGVGSGARHQALVRLACYLIPRHHYDIVKQNLLDWNQKNTPPLSDDEVVKQLNDLTARFKRGQYKSNYVPPKELSMGSVITKPTADIITAKGSTAYFESQLTQPVLLVPELATGFPTIDKPTYGFTRGNLFIVGARPGTGKTSFIINAATHLCKNGKRVLYFSTESTPDEMRNKFASSEAEIPFRCFKEHNFDQVNKDKLMKFAQQFEGYDIHFVKSFAPSIKDVQQATLDIKPDVLIFDHIQHITTEGNNEYSKISEFTRFLKSLALQTNTAVVVASQLSRTVVYDGVIPELHHLKGCGTLEEEGTVVILMHDDTKKGDRPVLFKVAKNRDGETGSTTLLLKSEITKFEDMGVPIV